MSGPGSAGLGWRWRWAQPASGAFALQPRAPVRPPSPTRPELRTAPRRVLPPDHSTALPCSRTLSNRVAAYSKRITTEGDTLAEEVATVCKRVDKALAEATRHLGQDDSYVDVIKELESAKGILFGNGAGGDL